MGEMRYTYKILVEEPEGKKRSLRRPRLTLEDGKLWSGFM
jgi:hypothetical protein